MRNVIALTALACLTFASGCGGGSTPQRSPEATIRSWVAAVNGGDWTRACELSVWPDDSPVTCEDIMRKGFQDSTPMELVGMPRPDDDRHRFGVAQVPPPGKQPKSGWTAYAGETLELEKHHGEYLVHFEVQIIR